MVYEITPENEILHLTDIKMPQEPKAEAPPPKEQSAEEKSTNAEEEEAAAVGPASNAPAADDAAGPKEEVKAEKAASVNPVELKQKDPAPSGEPTDTAVKPQIEAASASADAKDGGAAETSQVDEAAPVDLPEELNFPAHASWTKEVTVGLLPILSKEKIIALHDLLLQGRNPPPPVRATDAGWGSRKKMTEMTAEEAALSGETTEAGPSAQELEEPKIVGWEKTQMNRGRGGGRDRGSRGGRGRGRGGFRDGGMDERPIDTREVLSDVRLAAVLWVAITQLTRLSLFSPSVIKSSDPNSTQPSASSFLGRSTPLPGTCRIRSAARSPSSGVGHRRPSGRAKTSRRELRAPCRRESMVRRHHQAAPTAR